MSGGSGGGLRRAAAETDCRGPRQLRVEAFRAGVDVEGGGTEEGEEGLVGGLGELDGEGGGGGDGGDEGEAAGEGFLHEFEGDAAGDEEEGGGEVEAVEEGVAEDLVEGVVAADVFVEDEEIAAL